MEEPAMEDVVKLTTTLIHQYCDGEFETWFSYLAPKSVFVTIGEGMLIGAKAIRENLQRYTKKDRKTIYQEEYFHTPINDESAVVFADIVMGKQEDDGYRISNYFTFVYQLIGRETKIIYEHTSYEYFNEKALIDGKSLSMDMYTFQFVKHLLLDNPKQERLCITTGSRTIFLDMNTLLYIQGDGHGTQLYCIDKTVSCTKSIREIKEELTDDFYQIHRSYIINTRYLTSLYCYKAELISGICLPIPALNYGKVKQELETKLKRPLRKKK